MWRTTCLEECRNGLVRRLTCFMWRHSTPVMCRSSPTMERARLTRRSMGLARHVIKSVWRIASSAERHFKLMERHTKHAERHVKTTRCHDRLVANPASPVARQARVIVRHSWRKACHAGLVVRPRSEGGASGAWSAREFLSTCAASRCSRWPSLSRAVAEAIPSPLLTPSTARRSPSPPRRRTRRCSASWT